ncbi:YoaK family protein [Pelagibacterium montanilacus]|uniref:YoaK family protein n=1 Tax=Pelagibacterium montanilacus TaxID=2185280 RepID=UPI001FE88F40|nr:YoaK family protein [Pelagibacterium montanilacus]
MTVKRRARRSRLRLFAHLADHRRTGATDFTLALILSFVAGGINAGGFLAIGRYTSHVTGYVAEAADHVALGNWTIVAAGLGAVAAFTVGAALSAALTGWARRHTRFSQYSLPLGAEAALLLVFGVVGLVAGGSPGFVLAAAYILCLLMGLQNATITTISGARIRTTHFTGVVTDIGIELGRFAYRNLDPTVPERRAVRGDRAKLATLVSLLFAFFSGGVVGAVGFGYLGYGFTVPLALLLAACALPTALSRQRRARASRGH